MTRSMTQGFWAKDNFKIDQKIPKGTLTRTWMEMESLWSEDRRGKVYPRSDWFGRLQQNRKSAKKCRQKKKALFHVLSSDVT